MMMNQEKDEKLRENGQVILENNKSGHEILLLSIIGEIEGHEAAPDQNKATRYDHVLPRLAAFEDDENLEGLLVLLNTQGGDVDAGLAIAEMIATVSKPTVSLVLGGSSGRIGRLFLYCTIGDPAHTSGTHGRNRHRRSPELCLF